MSDTEAAARPLAILAGSGLLPILLAERLRDAGRPHRILAFRGFAARELRGSADAVVDLLDLRAIAAFLERWRPAGVLLAGGLSRPGPAALLGTLATIRNRTEIAAAATRGDDGLLRGAMALIEERGFPVIGLDAVAPDLLARSGSFGTQLPSPGAAGEIDRGLALLSSLSPFDIGQAVVIRGEQVIAVEGPEGTDATLHRARRILRTSLAGRLGRAGAERGGVLVKAAKVGQDLRVDLPAIGPRTVTNAARAGLAGIAILAGRAIVLDEAETARRADRAGLFVVGIAPARADPR